MAKIIFDGENYIFDAENGTESVICKVWLEKAKANEAHPNGKPWIVLPKENVTNRTYFSLDKFNAENIDGELSVEIKTSAPRVLGASGIKTNIIKYLDEAQAEEYTVLVNAATEAYKAAKVSKQRIKPEDMSIEQLQAYIDALKNGTKVAAVAGPKSFIDMFSTEDYDRYNELLAISAENKANAPKAARGKLTEEEKAARATARKAKELGKAEELLRALQASISDEVSDEEDYE